MSISPLKCVSLHFEERFIQISIHIFGNLLNILIEWCLKGEGHA